VGGHDVKEVTNNFITVMLKNNVASYFNLNDRRGIIRSVRKTAFLKLALYKVVQGNAKMKLCYPLSQHVAVCFDVCYQLKWPYIR
jgi:hypothetical protein